MDGEDRSSESLAQLLQNEGVDPAQLREILDMVHPLDLAEFMEDLPIGDRVRVIESLSPSVAAQVLTALTRDSRIALVDRMGEARLKEVIEKMPAGSVAEILDHLPIQKETSVMMKLDRQHAERIQELRQYAENTAGGRMTKNFVAVPESFTADETLKAIQGSVDAETIEYVYVVDEEDHVRGVCTLRAILTADPETPVSRFMHREVTFVGAHLDQEEVARVAKKYNLKAIPVVDDRMRLVGVITLKNILEVVHQEANEDIMKLAGAEHVHPIHAPFLSRIKARLPWLGTAMALELVIAWIMKGYHHTLTNLTLAYFIPVIMAMGGSVGLQSATMVVRGLATGELTVKRGLRVILAEFRTGLAIGVLAGIATGAMAYLMEAQDPVRLGGIVVMSMAISITIAATLGTLTPLLLQKMKFDPAVASGPFITALNDVINVTIYLTIATAFILRVA